jgi:hypothetical protein
LGCYFSAVLAIRGEMGGYTVVDLDIKFISEPLSSQILKSPLAPEVPSQT